MTATDLLSKASSEQRMTLRAPWMPWTWDFQSFAVEFYYDFLGCEDWRTWRQPRHLGSLWSRKLLTVLTKRMASEHTIGENKAVACIQNVVTQLESEYMTTAKEKTLLLQALRAKELLGHCAGKGKLTPCTPNLMMSFIPQAGTVQLPIPVTKWLAVALIDVSSTHRSWKCFKCCNSENCTRRGF